MTLGKVSFKHIKTATKTASQPQIGSMIFTDVEKYCGEWPQVARIVSVKESEVTVQWYRGSESSAWLPCILLSLVAGEKGPLDRGPEIISNIVLGI